MTAQKPVAQDEVQRILDAACAEPHDVPGAVFLSMDRSGTYLARVTSGVRGLNKPDQKMSTDTAFIGFSCTKLITAIACLQLVERGQIDLDEPVDKYLPDIADIKMLDGSELKRKITLRMLLSHTAGFTYGFFNEAMRDWAAANLPYNPAKWETYKQPLIAQPGEDWNYGISMDWAGKVLEAVTGVSIAQYCNDHIFAPLGISDITFNRIPPACQDKVATMHARGPDGKLVPIDHPPAWLTGEIEAGGAGCVMTPDEYIKVLYLLINEGRGLNGSEILKPETIELMFADQLDGSPAAEQNPLERTIPAAIPFMTNPVPPIPDTRKGWSFAGMLTKDRLPRYGNVLSKMVEELADKSGCSGRSAESVWWAGLGNLYWMADREKGLCNVIMSQYFPFYDEHTLTPYRAAEKAVYDHL